jgi:hypothetical protein
MLPKQNLIFGEDFDLSSSLIGRLWADKKPVKLSKYSIRYQYKYKHNDTNRWVTTPALDYEFEGIKKEIGSVVYRQALKDLYRRYEAQTIDFSRENVRIIDQTRIDEFEIIKWMKTIGMKNRNSPIIKHDDILQYEREEYDQKCFKDAFQTIYGTDKHFNKWIKNDFKLLDELLKEHGWEGDGISVELIEKIAPIIKFNYYALDLGNEIISTQHNNDHCAQMVFKVSNNHLYLLTKTSALSFVRSQVYKNNLVICETDKNKKKSKDPKFARRFNKTKSKITYIIKSKMDCETGLMVTNTLEELYWKHFNDTNELLRSQSDSLGIKTVFKDGVKYIRNDDFEKVKQMSITAGIDYVPTSNLTSFITAFSRKHGIDSKMLSTYDTKLYKDFVDQEEKPFSYHVLKRPSDEQKLWAVDAYKSFSSCYVLKKYPWCIVQSTDVWEPCDKYTKENALYRVKFLSNQFRPVNSEILIREAVEFLIKYRYPFEIIGIMRTSVIPHNYFKKFVDVAYELYDPKTAKDIVNRFNGLNNVRDFTKINTIYTNNKGEALHYYDKRQNDGIHTAHIGRVSQNRKLWQTIIETPKNKLKHGSSVYHSILQLNNIKMFNLAWKWRKSLVAIKTDCCIFDKNLRGHIKEEETFGGFKFEHKELNYPRLQKRFDSNLSKYIYKNRDFQVKDFKWKSHDIGKNQTELAVYYLTKGHENHYIDGAPGCGKSHLLKEIQQYCDKNGKKYKTMSLCSLKATDISGKTIHKSMGIDIFLKGKKNIPHIFKDIDYVLIDEISNIDKELWQIIKVINDQCIILGFGDFNQLQSIGEGITMVSFMNLFDCNRLNMTYDYRNGKCVQTSRAKILNDKPIAIRKAPKMLKKNIVKTNAMRRLVNKLCNVEFAPKTKKHRYPTKTCDGYEAILHKGCLVMATKNTPQYDNNEIFRISKITRKIIHLKSLSEDKAIIELSFDQFYRKKFRLAYAFTNYCVQGQTINKDFCIWEFDKMSKSGKYVSITRAKKMKQVYRNDIDYDDYTKYSIYKITSNDKVYIGNTVNCKKREKAHREATYKHLIETKLYKCTAKYGMKFEVLCYDYAMDRHEILETEDFYIRKFDSVENGLNSRYNLA